MLAPADRHTLLDLLRPPLGATLDRAVGTTFSLNLDALLVAPAAFALFETGEEEAQKLEPLGLLDALRRHADRITIFCQAGQITPPPAHRRLLAYLEHSVLPVTAPRGGVFHPKVWVLRYRYDDGEVAHRALVLSRNLTHDRSWDTALRLESLPPGQDGGVDLRGLGEFVARLPNLVTGDVPPGRADEIADLARDLRSVRWELPTGFETGEFVPIGLTDAPVAVPLPAAPERMLVISPFLGSAFLSRVRAPESTLVALPTWLQHIGAAALDGWDTYVLDDAADPDASGDAPEVDRLADPRTELSGLHAKLYLAERGDRTTVLTGSANATTAGWDRNVEAVVRLEGPTATIGSIAQMLDDRADPIAFGRLLLHYRVETVADGELEDPMAGEELDQLRRELASGEWLAQVAATDDLSTWQVRLRGPTGALVPDDVEVRLWPVSLPPAARAPARDADGHVTATFPVSTEGLTAFFGIQLRRAGLETQGVVKATLDGVPDDRHRHLLAALIGDADRLLRYLLLLLADASGTADAAASAVRWASLGDGERLVINDVPLLEAMLRAVTHSPDKLAHIERLLADLREAAEDSLVPDELDRLWQSVWTSVEEGRR